MEDNSDDDPTQDLTSDDDPILHLAESLREITLATLNKPGLLGNSSGGMLVHTAIELNNEHMGDSGMFGNLRKSGPKILRAEFWGTKPVRVTVSNSFARLISF